MEYNSVRNQKKGHKTMDKVTVKMVREAKAEFDAYCKKHGDMGKVQVALEDAWLELKKAYNLRKEDIRCELKDKDPVVFYESDNLMSFPAFNCLYTEVWEKIANIVIALEDGDEDGLAEAINAANDEKRIKLGKLLLMLK